MIHASMMLNPPYVAAISFVTSFPAKATPFTPLGRFFFYVATFVLVRMTGSMQNDFPGCFHVFWFVNLFASYVQYEDVHVQFLG